LACRSSARVCTRVEGLPRHGRRSALWHEVDHEPHVVQITTLPLELHLCVGCGRRRPSVWHDVPNHCKSAFPSIGDLAKHPAHSHVVPDATSWWVVVSMPCRILVPSRGWGSRCGRLGFGSGRSRPSSMCPAMAMMRWRTRLCSSYASSSFLAQSWSIWALAAPSPAQWSAAALPRYANPGMLGWKVPSNWPG